jgi:hypothetical protein
MATNQFLTQSQHIFGRGGNFWGSVKETGERDEKKRRTGFFKLVLSRSIALRFDTVFARVSVVLSLVNGERNISSEKPLGSFFRKLTKL